MRLYENYLFDEGFDAGEIRPEDGVPVAEFNVNVKALLSFLDGITREELDLIIFPILRDEELLAGWTFPKPESSSDEVELGIFVEVMELFRKNRPASETRIEYYSKADNAMLKSEDISYKPSSNHLLIRGQEIPVSGRIKQIICETLFSKPFGTRFTTVELEEIIDASSDKSKQSNRRVYDAVLSINKDFKKSYGVDRLIQYSNEKYWLAA